MVDNEKEWRIAFLHSFDVYYKKGGITSMCNTAFVEYVLNM